MPADLPFIDEYDTLVEASAPEVFLSAARRMSRAFEGRGARFFSRALGCVDRGESFSVPPEPGQEANGFRVAAVDSPKKLVLEGQHRFATYRLSFLVDPLAENRSQLRARTEALFPGVLGAVYRALVIGSGGHEIVVRRLLLAIAADAEHGRNPG